MAHRRSSGPNRSQFFVERPCDTSPRAALFCTVRDVGCDNTSDLSAENPGRRPEYDDALDSSSNASDFPPSALHKHTLQQFPYKTMQISGFQVTDPDILA